MKINIKATNLELTPALNQYISDRLESLAKFVKRFDYEGLVELWLEIGRSTEHHYKGPVFFAEADLRLPKKILRAVERAEDLRAAIDLLRNTLRREIEKYKTTNGKFFTKTVRRRSS